MIEIKYLSDNENYTEITNVLENLLGQHYTGALKKEEKVPYWVDAIAVYADDILLDIRLFDPYWIMVNGIPISQKGYSDWLCHICDNENEMVVRGFSLYEITRLRNLSEY